ncbi:transcription factor CP2-like protein 1, partial [Limulus polyphemus]|uniref:Transcription factor CP2-like protein 1 n=1 Tax=Limulus polyphemus TaxID=6850 RepID=A0ABM1TIW4_LIMPO
MAKDRTLWLVEEIDSVLAADLDTNLSGLGVGSESSAYNMSEAISALQCIKTEDLQITEHSHKEPIKNPVSEDKDVPGTKKLSRNEVKHQTALTDFSKALKKFCVNTSRSTDTDFQMNENLPEVSVIDSGRSATGVSQPDLTFVSAPSVTNFMSFMNPGLIMKESGEKRLFQCVLGAPTALGVKITEETLTYLNQGKQGLCTSSGCKCNKSRGKWRTVGQSYEVRIRKMGDPPELKGKMLKSFIKVRFQERRLQYREKEEIAAWKISRPGERILDVDLPLSYGIFDVNIDPAEINSCHFVWDPAREASIFIRVNCISTEFTSRRRGGEKGVILRFTISTWTHGEKKCQQLDLASCQLKVFKSKGADRKHRTDRERMEKRPPEDKEKYQPSYQCTILTEYPPDSLVDLPESPCSTEIEHPTSTSLELNLSKDSPLGSPDQLTKSSSSLALSSFHEVPESQPKEVIPQASYTVLPYCSSAEETAQWLKLNRFEKYQCTFSNFCASDIMRLNRDDLIQICGVADGIRLYNALHSRTIRPKLTIYVASSNDQAFHAVYLETFTVRDLLQKFKEIFRLQKETVNSIYMLGPSGIRFHVTDM